MFAIWADELSVCCRLTGTTSAKTHSSQRLKMSANKTDATISKSAAKSLWRRLPQRHRKMGKKHTSLNGVKRLSDSFRARPNRLQIDSHTNEIVRLRDLNKFAAWLGKNDKHILAKIDENVEVVRGMRTDNFAQYRELVKQRGDHPEPEACCLSIIFRDTVETIDLIAPNQEVRDKWYAILDQQVKKHRFDKMQASFDDYLLEQFARADLDHNNRITFKEVCHLLDELGIFFDSNEARARFDAANFRTEPGWNTEEEALEMDEFIEFIHQLSFTKILDKEFKTLSNGAEILEFNDLQKMLVDVQRESKLSIEQFAHDIIRKYEPLLCSGNSSGPFLLQPPSFSSSPKRILCSRGFRNMLLGTEFDIWNRSKVLQVYQDMSRPLTDYYFSASHNTYLEEDQLQGRSTTETYRLYLTSGCRSVEIDITDGDDDEPIVVHKNSLTTKLKLSDVVCTVEQFAFVSSPYPVIISLENNCSGLASQRMAARIFQEGFGSKLLTQPLRVKEERWPSPEALKGKILIKGKVLPPSRENESIDELERRAGLAKEISDLVFYGVSQKLTKLEPVDWKYNEMCSLEEGVSLRFANDKKSAYRQLTTEHMVKVYPFGLRVLSGNFDPLPHWHCGAQMVAMNFQTKDRKMGIYEAFFRNNGSCGYVLKPDYCLPSTLDNTVSMKPSSPTNERYVLLTITVLCALNLPPQSSGVPLNPYVTVKKYCAKKSSTFVQNKFKTSVVHGNALNPEFGQKFTFKCQQSSLALTFIRFKVSSYSLLSRNALVGSTIIPVDLMLEGFRNITLRDENQRIIENAKLIVKIAKNDIAS